LRRSSSRRHSEEMPDGDLEDLLRRQDGVVSRLQATRFVSAKALWGRAASGRWQIAHRGVDVNHNGPLTERQRLWVASLASGGGRPALLGGVTALGLQGLRNFDSPDVHVLVPLWRRSYRAPPGVRVHRSGTVTREDFGRSSPPATTPARSLVDAAAWALSDRQARTIVAMCFQQRLVSAIEVEAVLARIAVLQRRDLIMRTVADAAGGAHSLGELDLVALCRREKLPPPSLQQRRDSRYLDAVWAEWGCGPRSTGRTTWTQIGGGRTWRATISSRAATRCCCASPRGWCATDRPGWPQRSGGCSRGRLGAVDLGCFVPDPGTKHPRSTATPCS